MKKFILAVLFAGVAIIASAQERYGVVNLSVNFMREEPDYAAELGDQSLMGTVVKIIDEKSYWLKIVSPDPYTAWVNKMGIVEMSESEIKDYIAAPKYMVTAEWTHVYEAPSVKARRVCDLVAGDLLRVGGEKSKGFRSVVLPSGKKGWVCAKELMDFREWVDSREFTAENLISTAELFLGVPYQWGGTSVKGVDCSGLTRTVFLLNGILLPRNASQQAKIGDPVDFSGIADGDFSNIQPGDLMFFGNAKTGRVTHVTLYIGDTRIIHSSQVVRINSLKKGEPDYYSNHLLHVRRLIGREDTGKGLISVSKSPDYFPQN